ncbi:peptidylprolyl isomerase [Paenibacillus lignilyticus]|uniref:Periplasmic chaperone PpiD n=1 Tax=Paenibacillus lignilyticus TaxID=1172615 RepID=A0ABS5CCP0_9BACL|nr:peptidyl-prolyl cis-trans isomerase [Paenibacillus lignilyticus]MBP3961573.1 peptidyl-prolyl cis-trans isomerase [Paenibacillus lignilyticus]MBP3963757.1 peptidyl-prolyl cis-trans isomerase [Paenibacillus lignilyticus]
MGKRVINKRNRFKNTYLWLFVAVIAVCCTAFILAGKSSDENWKSGVVATVDDEPITVEEFMPKLVKHRSEILAYFKKKHNVEPDKGFWTSSYDGEIPGEMLKKAALDECITIKVQQIAGKEKELVKDISYSQFLKDLHAENARRKTAVENKKVIYGPEQYTEDVYFSKLFTDMTHKLMDEVNEQHPVSEEEIKHYYDHAISENKYKKIDQVKVEKIAFLFKAGDDKSKAAAKELAEEAQLKLADGDHVQALSARYGKNSAIHIESGEQIFDSTTSHDDYMPATHEFTETAVGLAVGQVSGVFEYNKAYYVVKCIEKTEEGFNKLEEVNDSIAQAVKEQKFASYVDDLVKKATVVIDKEVYSKLEML